LFKGGQLLADHGEPFFGFGLLLALTPCVFPHDPDFFPASSSVRGTRLTKSRALGLSLAYVLGMALHLCCCRRWLRGHVRHPALVALQEPWVLGGFALIFVALAFSMFGFYELQMPSFHPDTLQRGQAIESRAAVWSGWFRHGRALRR